MNINIIKNLKEYNDIIQSYNNIFIMCSLNSCIPCKKIQPFFEELNNKYNNIHFFKIMFDELDDKEHDIIKKECSVNKFPSFIIINERIILDTKQTTNQEEIENLIKYL